MAISSQRKPTAYQEMREAYEAHRKTPQICVRVEASQIEGEKNNGEHYAVSSENSFQELYPQMAILTSTAPYKIYCFNCFYMTVYYNISLLIVLLTVLLIMLILWIVLFNLVPVMLLEHFALQEEPLSVTLTPAYSSAPTTCKSLGAYAGSFAPPASLRLSRLFKSVPLPLLPVLLSAS